MIQIFNFIYLATGVLTFLYTLSLASSIILSIMFHEPLPAPCCNDNQLKVTVLLPVYNEKNVINRLLNSVSQIAYPLDKLEIRILDDSSDDTSKEIESSVNLLRSQGFDIHVIRRSDRKGYKTGALNADLASAKGDLIVVFDSDFLPPRDFLTRTVPYFVNEPGLGFVQTKWGYINDHQNVITMAQAIGLDLHFGIEKIVEDRLNLFLNYNGSGAVWRKKAISDVGGWPMDTLSEDLEISYRAQLMGWKAQYLPDIVVMSELPPLLSLLSIQQERWAEGAIIVLLKLWQKILTAKISFRERLHALFILSGYAFPIVFPLQLITLTVLLVFSKPSPLPALATLGLIVINIIAIIVSQKRLYHDWFRRSFYSLGFSLISVGTSVWIVKGVVKGMVGNGKFFYRTPKFGRPEVNSSVWIEPSISRKCSYTAVVQAIIALSATVGLLVALVKGNYFFSIFLFFYSASFYYVSVVTFSELLVANRKSTSR